MVTAAAGALDPAEMASLAAIRRTYDDLAELRRCLAAIENSRTPVDAVQADAAFHASIAKASKNDYYQRFVRFLGARLVPPRSLLLENRPPSEHQAYAAKIASEHLAIVEAIAEQDPVKARAAARSHMQISLERHAALSEVKTAELPNCRTA